MASPEKADTAASQALWTEIWTIDKKALLDRCKSADLKVAKTEDVNITRPRLLEHLGFGVAHHVKPTKQDAPAILALVQQTLKPMLDSLQSAVACVPGLQASQAALTDSIASLRLEIHQLKEDNSNIRAKVAVLEQGQSQTVGLGMAVEDLEVKLAAAAADQQEIARRSAHLRLTNLPDCNSQTDAEVLVPELLASLGTGAKATSVQYFPPKSYASAASANAGNRPRSGTVVVVCASAQEKGPIYRSLKKLQGTKFHHTHVDDNLTQRQSEARKSQQATFQALRQENKRPQWRGTQIFVDGKRYQGSQPTGRQTATATPPTTAPAFTHSTPISTLSPLAQA